MKNLGLLSFTFLSILSILTTHAIGSTNSKALAIQHRSLEFQEVYVDTSLRKKAEASTNNTLKAKKRGNLISLEWQDESDSTVKFFEIERSGDGTNFKKIGEAAKNQEVGFSYVFIDQKPLQVNHYRVKIINENGEHNYSKEIVISQNSELYSAVQPNPFINSFTVEVYVPSPQPIKIQLLDLSGRLLRYKSLAGTLGTNKIEFDDVGSLQKGIYMVRIVRGHAIIEKKIVKSN